MSKSKIPLKDKIGEPIKSSNEFEEALLANKALYHKSWGCKPARVFGCMQWHIIQQAINERSFFKYYKEGYNGCNDLLQSHC